MPRPVARVRFGPRDPSNEEESDGIIMGPQPFDTPYEMLPEFEFPEDIESMTWEEREELYRRHARHNATANSSDLSPSSLIDPDVPRQDSTPLPGSAFDDEHGYVVGGEEDEQALAGRLSPEAMDELRKRRRAGTARPISRSELHNIKMSSLPRLEREAEERFGNL